MFDRKRILPRVKTQVTLIQAGGLLLQNICCAVAVVAVVASRGGAGVAAIVISTDGAAAVAVSVDVIGTPAVVVPTFIQRYTKYV